MLRVRKDSDRDAPARERRKDTRGRPTKSVRRNAVFAPGIDCDIVARDYNSSPIKCPFDYTASLCGAQVRGEDYAGRDNVVTARGS